MAATWRRGRADADRRRHRRPAEWGVGATLSVARKLTITSSADSRNRSYGWKVMMRRASHRLAPTDVGCNCASGDSQNRPYRCSGDGTTGDGVAGDSQNRPYRCRVIARRVMVRRATHSVAPTDAGGVEAGDQVAPRRDGGRFSETPLRMSGYAMVGDSQNRPYRCGGRRGAYIVG